MHSSLEVSYKGARVMMIDCGADSAGRVLEIRGEALRGIRLYIRDGATLHRPTIRKKNGSLIGHSAIRTQLAWCRQPGVPIALFTHCGSEIVRARPRTMRPLARDPGPVHGVETSIAVDGMEVILP
jgi:hypothetical protein